MGRRTAILDSIVADLKATGAFAEVRRVAVLPSSVPSTQFPFVAVWHQLEQWTELQFPGRVAVDATIVLDVYYRTGARDDVYAGVDTLLEAIADALYANSSRFVTGVRHATQTSIRRVDFAETDEAGLGMVRVTVEVRSHRVPGVES